MPMSIGELCSASSALTRTYFGTGIARARDAGGSIDSASITERGAARGSAVVAALISGPEMASRCCNTVMDGHSRSHSQQYGVSWTEAPLSVFCHR